MVQGERESGDNYDYEPSPVREAFENSSLVRAVLELEATKISEPSFQSLNIVLPPAYEKQRVNYAIRQDAALLLIMQDPEFKSLWQDLIEEPKKPGKKFGDNRQTEEAVAVYTEFLASDAPPLGRIAAAAPIFRDYMRKTAEYENLGPFFRRIIDELRKGEPEIVAFLIASEHHLEVFHQLDYTAGWVSDRLEMKGGESWAYFQSRIEEDPEKKEQILKFVLGDLEYKEALIKSSAKFRKFTAEVLDIYFDINDTSDWRKFIRNYFPNVMAGFRYFSPEEYDPNEQYQRLQGLFEHVSEEDWGVLSAYFVLVGGRYAEMLDKEILNGQLDRAKAFTEFEISISGSGSRLYQQGEHEIQYIWADDFLAGKIPEDIFLATGKGIALRRKALGTHASPFEQEMGALTVELIAKPDIHQDADLIAELIEAGISPDGETRQRLRDNREHLEILKAFARPIAELEGWWFSTHMLPVISFWTDKFLTGEIDSAQLDVIRGAIIKIKKVENKLLDETRNRSIQSEMRSYVQAMISKFFMSEQILEGKLPSILEKPNFVIDLILKHKILPTEAILDYLAANGEDSIEQLRRLQLATQDGMFDPENRAQWDLEFSRYWESHSHRSVEEAYGEFSKIPFVEDIEATYSLTETDIMEAKATALEAARVYWLIKEEVDLGRDLVVVANERYGKLFVIDPLEDELGSIGVRIRSTYVRSGASQEGKVEKVFGSKLARQIKRQQPDIFVVDGTATPVAKDETTPRFSRAMLAFYRWFEKSDPQYSISFFPAPVEGKVQLGEESIQVEPPGESGPKLTIVNSTLTSDKRPHAEMSPSHRAGYFDDYETNVNSTHNTVLSRNGLTEVKRVKSARYLAGVQRTIKENVPDMIMSPESDPHLQKF